MQLTQSCAVLQDSCLDAYRHLEQVMNPYILNVSMATRLCSRALCQGQGRCVRKNWDDDVFLHLDPSRYRIGQHSRDGPLNVSGDLSQEDVDMFNQSFDCICYSEESCKSVLSLNSTSGHSAGWRVDARPRLILLGMTLHFLKHC